MNRTISIGDLVTCNEEGITSQGTRQIFLYNRQGIETVLATGTTDFNSRWVKTLPVPIRGVVTGILEHPERPHQPSSVSLAVYIASQRLWAFTTSSIWQLL